MSVYELDRSCASGAGPMICDELQRGAVALDNGARTTRLPVGRVSGRIWLPLDL